MILAQWEVSVLVEKGGPLVWILLALGFYGSVCIMERLFYFHRARVNVTTLLLGLAIHIRKQAYAEAVHEAARVPGPVGRVLHAGLLRYYLPRRDLMDVLREAGQLEVAKIEKNIRAVLSVALLAPLIGFMGTMFGMLDAFQSTSVQAGASAPTELAAGVISALITSVMGLMIAVPMYIFYLYLQGRALRLIGRLERIGIELVHLISDVKEQIEYKPFHEKPVAFHKDTKAAESESATIG